MLTHIHIRDFAIIEELNLELLPGLTALTGETGAGKSILLDAIGLVLGDKANSSTVRHGAERAEITLSIDTSNSPAAQSWLVEQALDNDEQCLLRRIISAQGKSRAWINGSPANLSAMRELGELMVDIHGQHEHQSLMKKDAQRQMLDDYADNAKLLEAVRKAWQSWKQLHERYQSLTEQSQQYIERLDLLRFQTQELEALAVTTEEITQLDEDLSRLSNVGQLRQTAEQNYFRLYEADEAVYSTLSHLLQDLDALIALDSQLEAPHELLTSAQIQIQEAANWLRDYVDGLDIDPAQQQHVEQRIADIRDMARKYRLKPEALPELFQNLQQELAQLDSDDFDLEALQDKCQQAGEHYQSQANRLSKARQKAAKTLAKGVSQGMQQLGMQGGQFDIQVTHQPQTTFSPLGQDDIEFIVSANPGQPLKPLMKVASGGELSRISLAIQMMAAQRLTLPALIFDEVDTGIGGGIAEIVGQQLRQLGSNRQVLCVTHLPQVAAKAHNHFRVTKLKSKNNTVTGIETLKQKQRVDEIARMIGGIEITDTTAALAKEMLNSP